MPSPRPGGTGRFAGTGRFGALPIFAVALIAMLAPSAPATATLSAPLRWPSPTVCLENRLAQSTWPLESAVAHYRSVLDLSIVLRPDCSGLPQRIEITTYRDADHNCGKTTIWRDRLFELRHARIRLNTHYPGCLSTPIRRAHVISHELGHAFGLPHTDHPTSVMNISTWSYDHIPYLTPHDTLELTHRY